MSVRDQVQSVIPPVAPGLSGGSPVLHEPGESGSPTLKIAQDHRDLTDA